ncbi:hypothetical protein F383_32580 [Gossypium arboreum]|uniref:Uncharacterized protein n=1 Tax=Gossypium arboreum TaxID=29729 RepID=A0A0B0PM72_GOSAR|nr:hypothetical protein F383_32580 [Gossypium arboreum]
MSICDMCLCESGC